MMDKFEKDKVRLAPDMDSSSVTSDEDINFIFNLKTWRFWTWEILGRDFISWGKLILFYFLFCSILALLWGLCMGVFLQTLDFYIPSNRQGLVGSNPALGFRPVGGLGSYNKNTGDIEGESVYSSLIWFRHGVGGNWQYLKKNIDDFLEQYEPGFFANQGASLTKCDFENTPLQARDAFGDISRVTQDKSCEFNKEWLSDQNADYKCITQEDFGYRHGKPCILLKMNRIYEWVPVPYTIEEVQNHTSMPEKLKSDIQSIYDEHECGGLSGPCPWLNMIWLHCDGENDPDIENIGPVTYTPYRGFPGYFFPYRNQRGYLSPIVMVQLKNPEPGVLMNIECTAWAKNIEHNSLKRRGLVHFELIMD